MPSYDFQCGECNGVFTKLLKISDRKTPESEPCPSCGVMKIQQVLLSAPGIADPVRIGVTKKDSNFNEVLKGIHNKTAGSKIDTFL
jgi:putative FmdB family regulatory protein